MKIFGLYFFLLVMVILVTFTMAPVKTPTREDVINTPWQEYQGVIQV